MLRLDFALRLLRREGMLLFPCAQLFPPLDSGSRVLLLHGRSGLANCFHEFRNYLFDVTNDRQVGVPVFADLGGIDVYVNNLSVRSEGGQSSGNAIIETNAQRD